MEFRPNSVLLNPLHVSVRRNGDPERPEITAEGVRIRYTRTPEFFHQVRSSIAIEVLKNPKKAIRANIQRVSSIDDPTLEHELKLGHFVRIVGNYVQFDADALLDELVYGYYDRAITVTD